MTMKYYEEFHVLQIVRGNNGAELYLDNAKVKGVLNYKLQEDADDCTLTMTLTVNKKTSPAE